MKKLTLFALAIFLCFACGCSRYSRENSFDLGNVPAETMQNMASDTASLLASEYPPGHTSVYVVPVSSKLGGSFRAVLENSLRNKGFTLSFEETPGAMKLLYKLDQLKGDDVWYLSLQFAGRSLARVYNMGGAEGVLSQTSVPENGSFTNSARSGAKEFKDGMNDTASSVTGKDLFD